MARKDRPIIKDADGTKRFKGNAVVVHLIDEANAGRKCDMNDLAYIRRGLRAKRIPLADWCEFFQLIGYSLDGYGEIFTQSKMRE